MMMVPVVVVSVVLVVVVSVAIMLIMTGVNPMPFAIEVAVDLRPLGPEMIGLPIFAHCLGTVRLVLEAVLDPVALAVQVSLDSFPFGCVLAMVSAPLAAVGQCRRGKSHQQDCRCDGQKILHGIAPFQAVTQCFC
jgi:hypothetical protein